VKKKWPGRPHLAERRGVRRGELALEEWRGFAVGERREKIRNCPRLGAFSGKKRQMKDGAVSEDT